MTNQPLQESPRANPAPGREIAHLRFARVARLPSEARPSLATGGGEPVSSTPSYSAASSSRSLGLSKTPRLPNPVRTASRT